MVVAALVSAPSNSDRIETLRHRDAHHWPLVMPGALGRRSASIWPEWSASLSAPLRCLECELGQLLPQFRRCQKLLADADQVSALPAYVTGDFHCLRGCIPGPITDTPTMLSKPAATLSRVIWVIEAMRGHPNCRGLSRSGHCCQIMRRSLSLIGQHTLHTMQ
jgi:hypothetical protein